LPDWSLGPVVEALLALRGVAFAVATGVVAEVGDLRRFDNPRQLMAYLGLVPGERSSGENRRPTSITKSGSIVARKLIVEAAWAYRLPAKVGQAMQRRQEGIAAEVRAIAWRAQLRLCALSPNARAAEKGAGRDHRGRSRTRRVHLGNRSQRRAENDRSLRRAANFEAAARTSTPVQGILRRFRERPCRSP
jgi:hypothetical protein